MLKKIFLDEFKSFNKNNLKYNKKKTSKLIYFKKLTARVEVFLKLGTFALSPASRQCKVYTVNQNCRFFFIFETKF